WNDGKSRKRKRRGKAIPWLTLPALVSSLTLPAPESALLLLQRVVVGGFGGRFLRLRQRHGRLLPADLDRQVALQLQLHRRVLHAALLVVEEDLADGVLARQLGALDLERQAALAGLLVGLDVGQRRLDRDLLQTLVRRLLVGVFV